MIADRFAKGGSRLGAAEGQRDRLRQSLDFGVVAVAEFSLDGFPAFRHRYIALAFDRCGETVEHVLLPCAITEFVQFGGDQITRVGTSDRCNSPCREVEDL